MLDNNETSVEWCSSQEGDYLAIFNKFNELGEQKKKSIHLELPLVINCFPLGPGFSSVAGGLDCNPIPPTAVLKGKKDPKELRAGLSRSKAFLGAYLGLSRYKVRSAEDGGFRSSF